MDDERFEELLRVAGEIDALDDPQARPAAGPACLPVARCAELARAPGDATPAEDAHLASCHPCRTRLAGFVRARSEGPAEPARGTTQRRSQRRLWPLVLALAAAAVVLVRLVLPPSDARDHDLRVALAPSAEDLFRTARGVETAEDLYVGVQAGRAGFVALVFLDDLGEAHVMALDPDGRESAPIAPDTVHSFGGYRPSWTTEDGEERVVTHVLVLVRDYPFDAEGLRNALAECAASSLARAAELEQCLRERLRCTVELASP